MEGSWSCQIPWLRRPKSEGPMQAGMERAGKQTLLLIQTRTVHCAVC